MTGQSWPDLSHLTDILPDRISAVVDDFPKVVTSKLGLIALLEHDIKLLDHTSAMLMSPRWRYAANRSRSLDVSILRPDILVLKGQTEFSPVVYYRALNKNIKI